MINNKKKIWILNYKYLINQNLQKKNKKIGEI